MSAELPNEQKQDGRASANLSQADDDPDRTGPYLVALLAAAVVCVAGAELVEAGIELVSPVDLETCVETPDRWCDVTKLARQVLAAMPSHTHPLATAMVCAAILLVYGFVFFGRRRN